MKVGFSCPANIQGALPEVLSAMVIEDEWKHNKQPSKAPFFVFLAVLLFSVLLAFKMIAPYFFALIIGGILALATKLPYDYLLRKNFGPKSAAAIITASSILLVIGPIIVFAVLTSRQAIAIATWFSQSNELSVQETLARISQWGPVQTLLGDPSDLDQELKSLIQSIVKSISSLALRFSKGIPGGFLQIVLACLALFFFLIDGRRLLRWISEKIPFDKDFRDRIAYSFKDTVISVLLANAAAASVQALLMTLSFAILGIPAAFLAGGATFLFAWIPLLGSFPVWIAGVAFLYAQASLWKAIIMLVVGIVTSTVDNVVRAWVLKGRSQMHPLVSLVSIFGGIKMFGLFGVILGPTVAAVAITVLQIWPAIGRKFGLQFGVDGTFILSKDSV